MQIQIKQIQHVMNMLIIIHTQHFTQMVTKEVAYYIGSININTINWGITLKSMLESLVCRTSEEDVGCACAC